MCGAGGEYFLGGTVDRNLSVNAGPVQQGRPSIAKNKQTIKKLYDGEVAQLCELTKKTLTCIL